MLHLEMIEHYKAVKETNEEDLPTKEEMIEFAKDIFINKKFNKEDEYEIEVILEEKFNAIDLSLDELFRILIDRSLFMWTNFLKKVL